MSRPLTAVKMSSPDALKQPFNRSFQIVILLRRTFTILFGVLGLTLSGRAEAILFYMHKVFPSMNPLRGILKCLYFFNSSVDEEKSVCPAPP